MFVDLGGRLAVDVVAVGLLGDVGFLVVRIEHESVAAAVVHIQMRECDGVDVAQSREQPRLQPVCGIVDRYDPDRRTRRRDDLMLGGLPMRGEVLDHVPVRKRPMCGFPSSSK